MKLFTLGLVLGSAAAQFQGRVQRNVQGRVQGNIQDNQAGFMNEVDFGGFMQNSPAGKTSFIQIFSQIFFFASNINICFSTQILQAAELSARTIHFGQSEDSITLVLTNQSTV